MSHGAGVIEVWICGKTGKLHPVFTFVKGANTHTFVVVCKYADIFACEHPIYIF